MPQGDQSGQTGVRVSVIADLTLRTDDQPALVDCYEVREVEEALRLALVEAER